MKGGEDMDLEVTETPTTETLTPIRLSQEREVVVMNAIYDFVIHTTENSKEVSPAELGALPEMIKLLIDYWAIQY